ncbi:MAG: hypothetical protein ACRDJH_20920, partial [Thermomicrobiales bacterium]
MRRDNPRDHAALSRHWDGIVGDKPGASADLPRDLAATVDTLHRLDRAPNPRSSFVDHLENELMASVTMNHAMPPHGSRTVEASLLNGRLRDVLPSDADHRLWPRRRFAELAAVAVLLLSLASAFAAYRLAPSGDGEEPTFAAVQAATPDTPALLDLGPEMCQVEPASLDRLSLVGTPTVDSVVPWQSAPNEGRPGFTEDDLPSDEGRPVDDETIAAVTETVRELMACLHADDAERTSALFTDDYWRRQNQLQNPVVDRD